MRRLEHLGEQLTRITSERDRVEREVLGCLTGSEALLTDLVSRFEAIDGHDWTPIPIVGYVRWTSDGGAMSDGGSTWESDSAIARCPISAPGNLPHATSRCAERDCGIVALRRLHDLDDHRGAGMTAVGRLALTGRVVEHEHGFRAELASATAIVVADGTRWFRTADVVQIERFFAAPEATFAELSAPMPTDAILLLETDLYLGEAMTPRRRGDEPPRATAALGEVLRTIVVEPIGPRPDDAI